MWLAYSHTVWYVKSVSQKRSRRAEAKERTRRALIEAGLELFGEQGIDGPSLDALCEAAGYTRGAFYVHFADREDFLAAVLERIFEGFTATIAEEGAADGLERSIDTFIELYGALRRLPAGDLPPGLVGFSRIRLLMEGCVRSKAVRDRFARLVADATDRVGRAARAGQAAGRVRDDVEAAGLGDVLVSLVLGLVTLAETGIDVDAARIRSTVLRLVERPVSGPRPRRSPR